MKQYDVGYNGSKSDVTSCLRFTQMLVNKGFFWLNKIAGNTYTYARVAPSRLDTHITR